LTVLLAPDESTVVLYSSDDPGTFRTQKGLFNVDENRVYMCGDSDGGRGAFNLCETEAGALAASVPVNGSPGGVTRYLNLRNLPFFAINGEKDTIFTVDHVRESVEGMKASGIDLTWKMIEGGGHDPRFFLKFKDEVQAFLRGKVLFRGMVEPDARAILEEGLRFLDRALVFSARVTLGVDGAEVAAKPEPGEEGL